MGIFALNLILAIIWVGLSGNPTPANFIGGFVTGFLILWLVERTFAPTSGERGYVRTVGRLLRFSLYFARTLIEANWAMVRAVLDSPTKLRPGIVSVPLKLENPTAITLLANWITLTPGTLSLDLSEDKRTLLIHTYDMGEDADAFRHEIQDKYERWILELFGPS